MAVIQLSRPRPPTRGGGDERHAGPVDEVGVGRRVEDREVGARAGGEAADVVAAQRAGAARGRGEQRLLGVMCMSRTASARQNAIEVV